MRDLSSLVVSTPLSFNRLAICDGGMNLFTLPLLQVPIGLIYLQFFHHGQFNGQLELFCFLYFDGNWCKSTYSSSCVMWSFPSTFMAILSVMIKQLMICFFIVYVSDQLSNVNVVRKTFLNSHNNNVIKSFKTNIFSMYLREVSQSAIVFTNSLKYHKENIYQFFK